MEDTAKPSLLVIEPVHVGRAEAQVEVEAQLASIGAPVPKGGWQKDHEVTLVLSDGKPRTHRFEALIDETRKMGACGTLRRPIEANDGYFPWFFEMATTARSAAMEVHLVGFKHRVAGPGRVAPVEDELTEDILAHRVAVVEAAFGDFRQSSRSFRSYVQSGIMLVEAFINRHVQVLTVENRSADATRLGQARVFEDKMATWESLYAPAGRSVRSGREWSQFSELRRERNRIVHAVAPVVGYSLDDMVRLLNYVRFGIGGLLLRMREVQGLPSLLFIERLRTVSLIRFRGHLPKGGYDVQNGIKTDTAGTTTVH